MNKKQLPYLFTGIFILAVSLFLLLNKKTDVEIFREKHAQFLKNHRFQNTVNLSRKERKSNGLPPNAYYEQKYLSEISPLDGLVHNENILKVQKELEELRKVRSVPGDGTDNPWIERGPDNVGGRTRAIIFDPNDTTNETVFAGGASGGLWKNTNISNPNSKWQRVGALESYAITCIAVDPNNSNVFYLGTGESYLGGGNYSGNGLWKSVDGGNTWTHLFGGRTGDSFFDQGLKLTVNSPASIAGEYQGTLTVAFGGNLNTAITAGVAIVDDGVAPEDNACETITNASEINGKIALIRRGSCNFDDKVRRAEDAGAVAVIMINNTQGAPIQMGGDDASITIPSLMVSQDDGNAMVNALSQGVNITLEDLGGVGAVLVPGIHYINDLVVRDVNGTSEVYVAVGESTYTPSIPRASLGGDSFGLYKSTDGTNFTQVSLPNTANGNPYEPNHLEIAADNSIYMSTVNSDVFGDGGGAIFQSTDGNTFTLKHTVPNGARTEITLSSSDANVAYILAQTVDQNNPVKIYKTLNGFNTVSEVALPNDADQDIPASDFTRGQASYDLIIKIDPSNDDVVYVGGIDIFKSTNQGGAWSQISKWSNNNNLGSLNVPLVHADQHGIAFASSNKVLFSNDGGVFYSEDGGVNISARNNNYNTLQFYSVGVAPTTAFGGDEYFLAGAQDNGTHLIANASAGINSSIEVSGGDGAASFFDTDGTDRYYITNYVFNGAILLFNYDTNSWKVINSEGGSNGDFINQEDLDSNLDILYSNYTNASGPKIRRYSNLKGVVSRNMLENGLMNAEPSALKVSPHTTNSSKLFVGLKNGKVLVVSNADTTGQWTEITGSNFVGSVSDIEFGETENDIFVTMHNYGVENIWYSSNGGTSWVSKEGDFPDIPIKTILQNPLNTEEVIVGTDIGVWKTSNFSAAAPNWTQSYNGMSNVPVLDLDLRDDNTVFAATYGRGVFSGTFTSDTATIKEVAEGTEVFTVYPTISKGKFTIFGKANLGVAKVNIYNIRGQRVHNAELDFAKTESNEMDLQLSSGMYLVNLVDSKNNKSTRKIVIE